MIQFAQRTFHALVHAQQDTIVLMRVPYYHYHVMRIFTLSHLVVCSVNVVRYPKMSAVNVPLVFGADLVLPNPNHVRLVSTVPRTSLSLLRVLQRLIEMKRVAVCQRTVRHVQSDITVTIWAW